MKETVRLCLALLPQRPFLDLSALACCGPLFSCRNRVPHVYGNPTCRISIILGCPRISHISPGTNALPVPSFRALRIAYCRYVLFDGFEITNFNQGIYVESADHVSVRNTVVHDVGQEGIRVRLGASFITFDHCTVHDTRQRQYNGEGFYIGTSDATPI